MSIIEEIYAIIDDKGIEHACSSIYEAITCGDFQTRMDIAVLLCENHCSFSEEILMILLNDDCIYVKLEAVDSLSILKAEKAYCELRKLCSSKNYLLRGHSIMAIAHTTPTNKKNETISFVRKLLIDENSAFVKICVYFSLCLMGEESQLIFLKQKYKRCGYRNKCFILNGLTDILYDRRIKDLSIVKEIIDIAQQRNDGCAVYESLCLLEDALRHLT